MDLAESLGKPLVLSEFGKKPAGPLRAMNYCKVSVSHGTCQVYRTRAGDHADVAHVHVGCDAGTCLQVDRSGRHWQQLTCNPADQL